jgi:peptidoglycan/LPS O-acetylase OafA/YrhL
VTRITALDGLRGIAALVVVFHHVLLVDGWFAESLTRYDANPIENWRSVIYYSPLHILFAGTEAVLVFFLLSGIVLVRAFPGWASIKLSYFFSRLTRLYLPIWGSLVFALGLTFFRPDRLSSAANWWLKGNFDTVTAEGVFTTPDQATTLLSEMPLLLTYDNLYSNWLNSSLWSMKIEILASLLLVVFVVGSKKPLLFLAGFVVAQFIPGVNPIAAQYLQFLTFFAAGAWLSVSRIRPQRLVANTLVLLSVLLFTIPWMMRGLSHSLASPLLDSAAGLVAATMLGFGVLGDSDFSRFLSGRFGQYMGSRSYSLYLVHAPFVTLAAFWVVNAFGDSPIWFAVAPFAVIGAIGVAELFHRVVERPSLNLSRRLRVKLQRPSS